MRKFKELRETNHSRVYKMIERSFVLGCPICGPNTGCNSNNKNYTLKNWKKFRKTQWKN